MAQATRSTSKRTTSDKPTIHATAAQLDVQGLPEPFVYVTKANHRITFPDVLDLPFEQAEEFLADMEGGRNSDVLPKWIGADDYAALQKDRLSLRKLRGLLDMVVAHYQGTTGDEGEG